MIDKSHLPNLILYKFLFNLEFLEDSLLPEYKGSTFRGALGWHLRKAVDNLPEVYQHIFETEGGENNPAVLKGVKNIPHPFILHPPLADKRIFKCGEVITVGITLIGYAHNFLQFFIEAFSSMGKSGITSKRHKFKLLNVINEDYQGAKLLVYESGSFKIKNNYQAITLNDILKNINYSNNKIKLIFETPLDDENINKISPSLLVAAIERRYKILADLFCRSTTDIKKIFVPDQSVTITKLDLSDYTMHRNPSRNKGKQDFDGLIGSINIEGDLKSILPILYIGEKINIGKKTSFGWGQYKIIQLD